MKYAALQDLVTAADNAQKQARRCYRLSERAFLRLRVDRVFDSAVLVIGLEPWIARGNGAPEFSSFDLGYLTAQELARAAEYRSMIADWESGKIDALPPSNLIDSPDEF